MPLFHTNALTAVQEDISNLGEAIQTAGDSKHRSDQTEMITLLNIGMVFLQFDLGIGSEAVSASKLRD